MDETSIFIYYSWWWWTMYIYNLNTQSYYAAITSIVNCGISNNVTSKYGNQTWVDNQLDPARAKMQPIWDNLDIFWFPAFGCIPFIAIVFIWIPAVGQYIFLGSMWAGQIAYLTANLVLIMTEW